MKFSILVPVYNVEKYLAACVDSLLDQTYSNLEVILVDDGSTDSSGRICDDYKNKYPEKVRVLHQKNQGQLLARENAMRLAAGDVLLFVDSDDCLRRDALELLNHAFMENGCDLILFNASTAPDFEKSYRKYPFLDGQIFSGSSKQKIYKQLVTTSDLNNLCLKAVRREVADNGHSLGGYAFVKNGEDLLVSMQLLTDAKKILFMDRNLYYYRQRTGSVIHSFNPNRAASVRAVHLRMEQYIDQWGYPELRAPHYGREVRGWLETLILLYNNRCSLSPAEYQTELRRMAEDPYFRIAYENMDAAVLGTARMICAKLLYEKRFCLLGILLDIRGILKKNT